MAERKRRAECEYGEAAEGTHYEEVESCYKHGFEYVDEHRVKTESAPLLRAIFKKYGDITSGNDVKSSDLLSIFLERICHVYQRLEQAERLDLSRVELQGMISELRLCKMHKLNVGWILERVEYKLIELMDKELGAYETQFCSLLKEISSIKAELLVMKQEVAAANVIDLEEEQVGAREEEDSGEVGSSMRRSTRLRKQPGWHKAFYLLDSVDLW
ncbi:hypothetical protein SASPL_149891 [Salvia splendens]|uniref:Uncharacterized protein n=1 Tax=Salvia splendens TaxID=180675 RepID=A0A8X8W5H1_SALSN|nr:uncharacterized protein LOC121782465 [Salvia splendens]KAG6388465.1 hypothetical protein SASPL_149891 [Salvia splendens]